MYSNRREAGDMIFIVSVSCILYLLLIVVVFPMSDTRYNMFRVSNLILAYFNLTCKLKKSSNRRRF